MDSQPQNPEFRINHENFHPCIIKGLHCTSLNLCMLGNFHAFFDVIKFFLKINFFKTFFQEHSQEHYQSVKRFGAGDKNISIMHLSYRTSDFQFSLFLQTHALVL